MKRIIITSLALFALLGLVPQQVYGQAPDKMSYQAVIRNADNKLIENSTVSMRISILQGTVSGVPVYVETQSKSTNKNGLVSIEIGVGSIVSGTFNTINWANGPYFIKTETDPTGGTNYTISGTTQLLSVPYSLYAKTAENATNVSIILDQIIDVNAPTPLNGQVLGWDGTAWVPQSAGGGSSYTAGTGLDLVGTTFNAQTGTALWNANKLQGNDIAAIPATNGQVLTWNGTTWTPETPAAAGGSNWTLNGSDINRGTGNVGIKTASPLYPLHITWDGQSGPNNLTRGIFVNTTARNTVNPENNNGVFSTINTNNASGMSIYGIATGSNFGVGVFGESTVSANGRGVLGFARSNTGDANEKIGIMGVATGTVGQGIGTGAHLGVYGESNGIGADNIGIFGIGGSSTGTRNYGVYGLSNGSGSNNYGVIGIGNATGGTGNVGVFGANATTSGTGNYAGYFNGDVVVTGTFTNPSDEKLKMNIQNLNSGLNLINNLRPVTYNHKPDMIQHLNLSTVPQIGFIAQELEMILPNLVKKEIAISKNDVLKDGNESTEVVEFKSINYMALIPVLTKAIQEQQEIIEELLKRIAALEQSKPVETK